VADPNKIPLDVRITVCADCGTQWLSGIDVETCKADKHHLSTVHYEISAEQNDSVASQRVADLQKHGRRLLGDDRSERCLSA
jgi:hypothetical protein